MYVSHKTISLFPLIEVLCVTLDPSNSTENNGWVNVLSYKNLYQCNITETLFMIWPDVDTCNFDLRIKHFLFLFYYIDLVFMLKLLSVQYEI